jgi:RNA polymerase sigma-70 factor (ECF subfamily)
MPTTRQLHSDTTSNPALLTLARAGRLDAIAALYETQGRRLFALAYTITGSREDAEDVVHDVFLGLPEALRQYDERGAGEAWLRRVTARVALSRLRSRKRSREVDLTNADDIATANQAGSSPIGVTLSQAIDSLPLNLRQVFRLREIEGYSHAEIGELLDISVSASQVRLHRAIRTLRERLGPQSRLP